MATLKVNEIFYSIQGESTHAGLACAFVRLTACDLRCSWCDTEYAFYEGRAMELEAVIQAVNEVFPPSLQASAPPGRLVEITGGEPLLQEETPTLCRLLLDLGYEVLVETGGHRDVSVLPPGVTIIMDLKCPSSGESDKVHWDNVDALGPGSEIKFVIAGRDDYVWARSVVEQHHLGDRFPVLFSPVPGKQPFDQLAEWILEDGISVRFQTQLHKHIWEPSRRGV